MIVAPRSALERRLALGLGQAALGETIPMAPQHRRRKQHRHADDDLDDVSRVSVRLGDERQEQLTRAERDRGAADEIDDEHAERELGDVRPGPVTAGEVQRGRDRRRVERIGEADRHRESDQTEHGANSCRRRAFDACESA